MPDGLMTFEEFSSTEWQTRRVLVVDFDGTIRYNKNNPGNFINSVDDIGILPNTLGTLLHYQNVEGMLIVGNTNQGGVAYGFKTMEQDLAEIERTKELLPGVKFQVIYSNHTHPEGRLKPFNRRSLCRKPYYGNLARFECHAFENGFLIDWDTSMMVGDREEDRACADAANIQFFWADDFFGRNEKAAEIGG